MAAEVSAREASRPEILVDIIRHILLKLPVRSVIRFQCVCKQWHSLIQDSNFKISYRGQNRVIVVSEGFGMRTSLTVTSITDNLCLEKKFQFRGHLPFYGGIKVDRLFGDNWPPRVWCCCNGVVLFNVDQHLLLWNPSIRCCTKVLELECLGSLDYSVISGLCYNSFTGDYKVVLLLSDASADFSGYDHRFVIVASLRNKEWRRVPFPYNLSSARAGINFHSTFHWMTSDIKREHRQTNYYDYDSDNSRDWEWDKFSGCNKIVYFDTECDEFKDLPTPEPRQGGEDSIVGLGIINDCLCMARTIEKNRNV